MFRGLVLLLWKNLLLMKRKWFVSTLEFFLPCISVAVILGLRQISSGYFHEALIYDSFNVTDIPPIVSPTSKIPYPKTWSVAYAPKSAETTAIMQIVVANLNRIHDSIGCSNEDELINLFNDDTNYYKILAGIVFQSDLSSSSSSDTLSTFLYKLRFPYKQRVGDVSYNHEMESLDYWQTELIRPLRTSTGPREANETEGGQPGYYNEGFLALQSSIDEAFIAFVNKQNKYQYPSPTVMKLRRMPFTSYIHDEYLGAIFPQIPLLIVLGFVFVTLNLTKNILIEKEKQLKETLKVLGINSQTHWLAWFITYFVLLTLSVSIMMILMMIKFSKNGKVLPNSNPTVIFVFLLIYLCTVIFYSFFISSFFKTASSGAGVAGFVFFVSYIPYIFVARNYESLSFSVRIACCMIPNIGFGLGMRLIGAFELEGFGLQWTNLNSGPNMNDNFNVLTIMFMLLFDCFILFLFTFYIDHIYPVEQSNAKPWYFPFTKTFWCPRPTHEKSKEVMAILNSSRFFQEDPVNRKIGISIRGLTKTFTRGGEEFIAVNDISLNIYRGHITVLLGHNGAGKTTTMSMLSGFIPPTSGTAIINDLDIKTDINKIRENLGYCPQHDILFDLMTVKEHMNFFARLKGCPTDKINEEITQMIERLKLTKKQDCLASRLSGGMRRRLSLGLALIADSKFVILDEPTSGLDPDSRREIWSLLQKEKEDRTILLSTHFMDEAEILGDRIIIMATGRPLCCGSPLFLKSCFGANYYLTVEKSSDFQMRKLVNTITEHLPHHKIETNIGKQVTILLPAKYTNLFGELFEHLERKQVELGIDSYGVAIITMEDIFLRAKDSHEISERTSSSSIMTNSHSYECSTTDMLESTDFSEKVVFNVSSKLYFQQLLALFYKRWIIFINSKVFSVCQILIPVLFTIIGIVTLRLTPDRRDSPALELSLNVFSKIVVPIEISSKNVLSTSQPSSLLLKCFWNVLATHQDKIHIVNQTQFMPDYNNYLIETNGKDLYTYTRQYLFGSQFLDLQTGTGNDIQWIAYFNNEAFHTPAILQNIISNAKLHASGKSTYSIKTINHPLPMLSKYKNSGNSLKLSFVFLMSLQIVFGMCFAASFFAKTIIAERARKSKQLQYLCGCKSVTYWISAFIWDLIILMIASICVIGTLAIFKEGAYIYEHRYLTTALLFFAFGMSIIPLTYLLSYLFSEASSGIVWMVVLHILLTTSSGLTQTVLRMPLLNLKKTADAATWTLYLFLPQYCLYDSLYLMHINKIYEDICGNQLEQCSDYNPNYLSWGYIGIGRPIFFLLIQFAGYTFILFFIETSLYHHILSKINSFFIKYLYIERTNEEIAIAYAQEDEDVQEHREQILSDNINLLKRKKSLIMSNVSKSFGTFRAVDNLTCAVAPLNCFGLLGVNGAGKSTTFAMLTGELTPTSGSIYLNGIDLAKDCQAAQRTIGYCPQFDALIDEMSAEEQLIFYCFLRGMKQSEIRMEVENLIELVDLKKVARFKCGTYSGGNKRKLSTAIALVGSPPLVLLDEPSTGMDPGAKRSLWNTLCQYRKMGKTLVLTSHSMEECEALCTEVVIMVNGRFQCLGSIQHLKSKYAEGYTAMVQLDYPSEQEGEIIVDKFLQTIVEIFGDCEVKDRHQAYIHVYFVKRENVTWSKMFYFFESNLHKLKIQHYSLSQSSLEQIFLNFARNQIPPYEAKTVFTNMKCKCACRGQDEASLDEDEEPYHRRQQQQQQQQKDVKA